MKYYRKKLTQDLGEQQNNLVFGVIFITAIFILLPGATWAATHTAASCSMSDVQAVINDSGTVAGDVVEIPAGTCTWGAGGTFLSVNKAITVMGAGPGKTIITLSNTGPTSTSGTIRISGGATVGNMTINGSGATAFSTGGGNGWRVTHIDYTETAGAYFMYVGSNGPYGLIDNCNITGGAGNAELIFARGPTDSWQTPDSIGGADNLFIEDNTFNGQGYLTDINSNGRAVVRYNTITGKMKIDGHGKATNSPPRGVREMEIYNNTWTNNSNAWAAIELRGGTGRIFNNVAVNTPWLLLKQYEYTYPYPNFNSQVQCPSDYPVDDQIGVGEDPKVAHSDPLYLWNNTAGGSQWKPAWYSVDTSACGVSFSWSDVVKAGRDYFISSTKPAAMDSYTPYGIYRNGRYYHPLQIPLPPRNLNVVP